MFNFFKGRKAPAAPTSRKGEALKKLEEAVNGLRAKEAQRAEEAQRAREDLKALKRAEKELDLRILEAMEALPDLRVRILDLQEEAKWDRKVLQELHMTSDEEAQEVLSWLASQDLLD